MIGKKQNYANTPSIQVDEWQKKQQNNTNTPSI